MLLLYLLDGNEPSFSQVDNMFRPNHWDSFCSELGENCNCVGLLLVSFTPHWQFYHKQVEGCVMMKLLQAGISC